MAHTKYKFYSNKVEKLHDKLEHTKQMAAYEKEVIKNKNKKKIAKFEAKENDRIYRVEFTTSNLNDEVNARLPKAMLRFNKKDYWKRRAAIQKMRLARYSEEAVKKYEETLAKLNVEKAKKEDAVREKLTNKLKPYILEDENQIAEVRKYCEEQKALLASRVEKLKTKIKEEEIAKLTKNETIRERSRKKVEENLDKVKNRKIAVGFTSIFLHVYGVDKFLMGSIRGGIKAIIWTVLASYFWEVGLPFLVVREIKGVVKGIKVLTMSDDQFVDYIKYVNRCFESDKTDGFEAKLEKYKKHLEEYKDDSLADDLVLKVENLTMQFGGLKAVDNLSFEVKKGEIFGLIGPNGAGKTTVFNCITQFYKPTKGTLIFREKAGNVIRLTDYAVHNVIKKGIVRTFQNVEVVKEITVLENLLVAAHTQYHSSLFTQFLHLPFLKKEEKAIRAKAEEVLEFMGLSIYKNMLAWGLPYGVLKKIEIARTLMNNPQLIILDEPAAGLNDTETAELTKLIRKIQEKYECTILLVEHDMGLVMDICDTICAISFGKLLAIGTTEEIQANKDVQAAYLGYAEEE